MGSFNLRQKLFRPPKRVLPAPLSVFRSSIGSAFGHQVLVLEHTGRRSGKRRRTPLEVVLHDGDSYIVCSETGRGADWYRNIKVDPATKVRVGSQWHNVEQRFLDLSEAATALARYETNRPNAAERLKLRLGVAHDGTHQSRMEIVARFPMVELRLEIS